MQRLVVFGTLVCACVGSVSAQAFGSLGDIETANGVMVKPVTSNHWQKFHKTVEKQANQSSQH